MMTTSHQSQRKSLPASRNAVGMACAFGAVACLASIIVHWSRHYPVHRSALDRQLFGDLSTDASPELTSTWDNRTAPVGLPDEPILVDVAPSAIDPPAAQPLQAPRQRDWPRFVNPVKHEEMAKTPTVWLTGGIEDAETIENGANSQPETIVFPAVPH